MPTNKARTSDNTQKQMFHIILFLIFQTSKRYDLYSVWACVSHTAPCHNYHQIGFTKRNLFLCFVVLLNKSFNFQKMFRTFFNSTTAKLTFYESVSPIVKMKHKVGFQSVAVAVVR